MSGYSIDRPFEQSLADPHAGHAAYGRDAMDVAGESYIPRSPHTSGSDHLDRDRADLGVVAPEQIDLVMFEALRQYPTANVPVLVVPLANASCVQPIFRFMQDRHDGVVIGDLGAHDLQAIGLGIETHDARPPPRLIHRQELTSLRRLETRHPLFVLR